MMAARSSSFTARPSNLPSATPSRPPSGATSSQQLQQEATNLESHFSQSQIALALSIAKSKPQNINIKGFCTSFHAWNFADWERLLFTTSKMHKKSSHHPEQSLCRYIRILEGAVFEDLPGEEGTRG
jgi:hypothetical protein